MSKIREIIMSEVRTEKDYSKLIAKIDDDGDLVLEGYDVGETPEKYWGDSDYEYWLTVNKDYKDTILLWLIKERFENDSNFKDWLDEKGIPSQFYSWV
jgi:hypothetical protein